MNPDIELISIGSELLSGRTLNTHAQTLGSALVKIGLRLSRDTTVPDESETIRSAVHEALERTDIVVVSGGLGPTSDDITRAALGKLFKRDIVMSPEALGELRKRYTERGRDLTPAAERQALILDGAVTLLNSVGAAPGERLDLPGGGRFLLYPALPVNLPLCSKSASFRGCVSSFAMPCRSKNVSFSLKALASRTSLPGLRRPVSRPRKFPLDFIRALEKSKSA